MGIEIKMGRQVRRVPPHWEHPRDELGRYKPLLDQSYEVAANKWVSGFLAWETGDNPEKEKHETQFFWEWYGAPPDDEYCRPKFKEEPTWYQVYEIVSEGTPVTPPFATKEELANYLVENGDFWDQKRGTGGYTRDAAIVLVNQGRRSSAAREVATHEL